ncbi:uncharacterized protein LOC131434107 [Malaya genurostris]|uniref:uncharacterized protein LOC131434107 n=1 Tax=Malaya genurostris TaxID=325434 RepID=UPI0026F385EF|nr:uncharacterized protein LOC131434107 [Malaya genurostris]
MQAAKAPSEKKMKAKEIKRRNIIEALKRMDEFLMNFDPTQHQHEVPIRLERLDKLIETFEMIQSEYEAFDDSEKFVTANLECRAAIEEQYFRLKAGLLSKSPQTVPVPVAKSSTANACPISSNLTNVKLPTITLPEFDGDFNNWLTFHDTFVSMIHSSTEISCVQKFHYLRASLKGEASSLIQSIIITAANYAIAWETLVKRYSNKVILRKKHIRALLKYPKIPNNSVNALHKIIDDFQHHTKVLQQLGESVEHLDFILMELLEDKLDDASLQAWEESVSADDQPTYTKMIEFLQKRTRVLETILINRPQHSNARCTNYNTGNKKSFQPRINSNAMAAAVPKAFPLCPACEKDKHSIMDCPIFNGFDVKGRLKVVADKGLCSNCFRSDHFARVCRSKYHCKHCNKRHHSMIHPGPFTTNQLPSNSQANSNTSTSSSQIISTIATQPAGKFNLSKPVYVESGNVILSTVVLLVVDAYGQEHIARALLDTGSQPNAISERLCQQLHLPRKIVNVPIAGVDDTGSQPNAISERLCQQLHLPRKIVNVPIAGVDGTITNSKYQIRAEIRSRVSPYKEVLDFLVLRKVTNDTPPFSIITPNWEIPEHFQFADPEFNVKRRVDMIIGAGHFYSLLLEGRFRLANKGLMLVDTMFGWLVTGKMGLGEENTHQAPITCHMATVMPVDELLERFWSVEECSSSNYSLAEQQCEDLFNESTTRDSDGRYIVRLPKKENFTQLLGASKLNAFKRFKWLEKKLEKDRDLKQQYHDFMSEYIRLGHMNEISEDNLDGPDACYLPHHPVIKTASSTTKVRVVFDGSAKTRTGHSLNDALLVGPVVQDELITNVLRFRKFPIALVADIEKMYRQVSMHPEDRRLQRIFWRFHDSQPIATYELGTVTYGLAPSSFLATRTLKQLADDDGAPFPKATRALKNCLYVDDFIGGEHSVEEAIQLRNELNELLYKGGFCLRKWSSNSPDVLSDLPKQLLWTDTARNFAPDETIKTLGVNWEPASDKFRFDVSITLRDEPVTKRSVLSVIAQLYDPLGLVAPVIVRAKILLQHLWLLALDWDDEPTGQLPIGRVTPNEAFTHTGVDYCGPLYLKPTHRRAAARKCYVAVFICLTTKAVNLELVGDLSTNTFLMALNRFIWRRNKPYHMYSDNGTNFIGAKNSLQQLYNMLQPGPEQNRISKQLAEDGIQWHLIPPRSPNFGGLWEAAVKVAKTHLVRQLGSSTLSYEELATVLTMIEGCMNSRPLTPFSDDPSDLSALTPAHFLVKNMIRPLPEPDIRHVPLNRLTQYQRIQAYAQRFWYRWRNEYLKQLQLQYTVNPRPFNLDVGSVVIIKDESLSPARWPLGRIVEIHPGPDHVTRVVTLRTSSGTLKRSVSKICPLPCTSNLEDFVPESVSK